MLATLTRVPSIFCRAGRRAKNGNLMVIRLDKAKCGRHIIGAAGELIQLQRVGCVPVDNEDFVGSRLIKSVERVDKRCAVMPELLMNRAEVFNQLDTPLTQIEYEEVLLQRTRAQQRLGLTLCYGDELIDGETDIFVSEIEPQSIAAIDGRIYTGDQILQINGVNVQTRQQAIKLFSSSTKTITLLLARPAADQSLMYVATDSLLSGVSSSAHHEMSPSELLCDRLLSPMPEQSDEADQSYDDVAAHYTDGTHEKDSGISRATDSDPELPPPMSSPESGGSFGDRDGDWPSCQQSIRFMQRPNQLSYSDSHNLLSVDACPSSATVTATPTDRTLQPLSSAMSSPGSEAPPLMVDVAPRMARSDSDSSLQRELAYLQAEMETIKVECDRLIARHVTAEKRVRSQVQVIDECMSSSAHHYESMDPDLVHAAAVETLRKQQNNKSSTLNRIPRPPARSPPPPPAPANYPHSNPHGNHQSATISAVPTRLLGASASASNSPARVRSRDDSSSAYNTGGESCRSTPQMMMNGNSPGQGQLPQVMYTDAEHLHETIKLQQRMLRQAMIEQAAVIKRRTPLSHGPVHSNSLYQALNHGLVEQQCEWKVKRRSDGSRYVTKRPVRNRILKEREQQLCNERVGLSTTDDDAMSELKIGRFWAKEDRKKHMDSARERKIRQQQLIIRKMQAQAQAADQPIVQLSQRKMQRQKGRQLMDRFTTVQELMSQGNQIGNTTRAMGILAVTTV